jgi:hypothetical protein
MILARFLNPPTSRLRFDPFATLALYEQKCASTPPADIVHNFSRDRDSSQEWILWQVERRARIEFSDLSRGGNIAGCAAGYARRCDLKNRAVHSGPRINPAEIIRALGFTIPWFILAPAVYVSRMVVSSPACWTMAPSFQSWSMIGGEDEGGLLIHRKNWRTIAYAMRALQCCTRKSL